MKTGARRAILTAVIVIYAVVLFELGALAYYAFDVGGLYYTSSTSSEKPAANALRLHPYFGWVNAPRSSGNAQVRSYNNRGFLDPRDIPFDTKDQFVVGIFGGSVAVNTAMHEFATNTISKRIQSIPKIACKQVTIVNAAKEAYKQPQQLFVLINYILSGQHFDAVLVIDGFNEVSSGWINYKRGIEVTMPGSDTLQSLATLADGRAVTSARVDTMRALLLRQEAPRCRLASCWLAKELIAKYLVSQISAGADAQTQDGQSLLVIERRRPNSVGSVENFLHTLGDVWSGASDLMKKTAESNGAVYIQFLQANQYFATGHHFSEEEKAVAFHKDHPYAEQIQLGYEELRRQGATLAAKWNGGFVDSTGVFDRTDETVYGDNCCHYSDRGNEIFSEMIAQRLAEEVEKARIMSSCP